MKKTLQTEKVWTVNRMTVEFPATQYFIGRTIWDALQQMTHHLKI